MLLGEVEEVVNVDYRLISDDTVTRNIYFFDVDVKDFNLSLSLSCTAAIRR